MILSLLVVGSVCAGTGVFDFIDRSELARADVEVAAESLLNLQGEVTPEVKCPRGLEDDVGASVVCTYVDVSKDVIAGAILGKDRPPPPTGRVEVRVSGQDHRTYGPGRSVSTPELSVEVIQSPR